LNKSNTVDALLRQARALGVAQLDAQLLAAHALLQSRTWVIAHGDEALPAEPAQRLQTLLQRRAAGEPLAYLVGEREFAGLRLEVTPEVLIPRPDTETLVDWALALLQDTPQPCIADLGTGSGAIALALAHRRPDAQVHASDASARALAVAQGNGQRLGLAVQWHHGSWFEALPAGLRFDLIASNPPYVAAGDAHLAALTHEPQTALVPQGDAGTGLADLERIVAAAGARLHPGGWLLLEHGAEQGSAVRALLRQAGFGAVSTRLDLANRERVSGAQRS
jgi:release factor glutamine methyltransferase